LILEYKQLLADESARERDLAVAAAEAAEVAAAEEAAAAAAKLRDAKGAVARLQMNKLQLATKLQSERRQKFHLQAAVDDMQVRRPPGALASSSFSSGSLLLAPGSARCALCFTDRPPRATQGDAEPAQGQGDGRAADA